MNWIGDIHNYWRFRSVQWGLVGAGAGAALAAYGTALAVSPAVVSGVPHWLLTVLTLVSMLAPMASMLARALAQPNLPTAPPKPPAGNDFHQGDAP